MSCLKRIVAAASLLTISGCSFHSAQWETAKLLWIENFSRKPAGSETFWWGVEYEGESFRLFPVAWKDKIVLTDASRWMIVLQNNDISLIRDVLSDQQISFHGAVGVSRGRAREIGSYSSHSESQIDSAYHRSLVEVSIVKGPIGGTSVIDKTSMFCHPSIFDSQALRLTTRCIVGTQYADFKMTEFDHSGNILRLLLTIPSEETWAIYRSDEVVDALEVKRFLEGNGNES